MRYDYEMRKPIWAIALITAILAGHGHSLQCFIGSCSKMALPDNQACGASKTNGSPIIKSSTCFQETGQQMNCISIMYKSILPFINDSGTYSARDIDVVRLERCYSWDYLHSQAPSLVQGTPGCANLNNLHVFYPPQSQNSGVRSLHFVNATVCACNTNDCNTGFQGEDFQEFEVLSAANIRARSGLEVDDTKPKPKPGLPAAWIFFIVVLVVAAVAAAGLCHFKYMDLYMNTRTPSKETISAAAPIKRRTVLANAPTVPIKPKVFAPTALIKSRVPAPNALNRPKI